MASTRISSDISVCCGGYICFRSIYVFLYVLKLLLILSCDTSHDPNSHIMTEMLQIILSNISWLKAAGQAQKKIKNCYLLYASESNFISKEIKTVLKMYICISSCNKPMIFGVTNAMLRVQESTTKTYFSTLFCIAFYNCL